MKITIDTEKLEHWWLEIGVEAAQKLVCDLAFTPLEAKYPFIVKREGVRKPKNAGYSPEFEQFWAAYPSCPNKTAKGTAWKEWEKLIKQMSGFDGKQPNEILLEACLDSLTWQKESDKWKQENGKYICKPENYLKGRMFEDEPPAKHEVETYVDMDGITRERKK